jgi:hypothetical protein
VRAVLVVGDELGCVCVQSRAVLDGDLVKRLSAAGAAATAGGGVEGRLVVFTAEPVGLHGRASDDAAEAIVGGLGPGAAPAAAAGVVAGAEGRGVRRAREAPQALRRREGRDDRRELGRGA